MKVLSLFDGISCGRVALERAGIPVTEYYASEVDKYAIKVALKNYPDTIQLGDVKNIWARNLPKIDLLIGGSPCQDLSITKAGRRGLNGERSSLFWHYVRLLRTCKPRWFLFENVASMPAADKAIITKELGVEPIMINSALVSAQQRKRLYWTNIPNITQPEDKGFVLADVLESDYGVAETICDFVKKKYDEFAEEKGYIPVKFNPYNKQEITEKAPIQTCCSNSQTTSSIVMMFEPVRIGNLEGLSNAQANRIYSVYGKSVCLNANGGGGGAKTGLYKIDLPDGDYYIRKLTPVECERLQTLPDNYTEGISNTQRYKCIGNGWTVDVIAHILRGINNETKHNKEN